jgi:hypothetical protein
MAVRSPSGKIDATTRGGPFSDFARPGSTQLHTHTVANAAMEARLGRLRVWKEAIMVLRRNEGRQAARPAVSTGR